MSGLNSLGLGGRRQLQRGEDRIEQILTQRPLHRVLSFTGKTIDDVVNSPLVKNEVTAYYRLTCQIERRGEITELEKQWNAMK